MRDFLMNHEGEDDFDQKRPVFYDYFGGLNMELITKWLPYVLAGISVGGQYALIAIGYTMVYGILRLINFALEIIKIIFNK